MKVTIQGETKDLKVTTITLERNPDDPLAVGIFHCPNCGEKVIQHQGNVYMIMPGGLPFNILEQTASPIAHCSRCKKKYLINNPA